jgi:hypothetical protein
VPGFITTSLWTIGGALLGLGVYALLGGNTEVCQPGVVDGAVKTCPDFLSTELGIYMAIGAVVGFIANVIWANR